MQLVEMILFVFFVMPLAWAQFPAVCNTEDSLSTKTCCPDNCGSHGTCLSIREEVESSWNMADQDVVEILRDGPPNASWPVDVRYQWPVRAFERICSCQAGWGGYNCSQCDFGFIANAAGECTKRNANQLLVRRNFRDLSGQERRNFIRLLQLAKTEEEKEWAVFDSEPANVNGSFTMQNVSTYDMLVFTHVLTSRERINDDCIRIINPTTGKEDILIDFAHRGPHFPTWHRYFLLLTESELRRIGEKVGIADFTLPYYDWTATGSCLMFTHELFGIPEYSDVTMNVSGILFENENWPIVCDQHARSNFASTSCTEVRTLCNITEDRMHDRRLERGSEVTERKKPFIPDLESVEMALAATDYHNPLGFSARLEGYVELCSGEAVKCMFRLEDPLTFNNMHNVLHIYYGGQVRNLQASVNDPIFFLHHANVDRILESWLQKYSGAPALYEPTTGGHPGWNLNDYHVPLFPLKTNADMYRRSEEIGYMYDGWPWSIPTTDFPEGCTNHTEPNTCNKGGCHPPMVVGTQCFGCY